MWRGSSRWSDVVCVLAGEFHAGKGQGRVLKLGAVAGKAQLEFPSGTDVYVRIWATGCLTGAWQAIALDWGQPGNQVWADPGVLADRTQRFYRVEWRELESPGDADEDGIDDVYEMRNPTRLDPLNRADAGGDSDGDGIPNLEEYKIEKGRGFPKIVLDAVADSPDPFSPALTGLVVSAQYRIRPTDGLGGSSHGQNDKRFYIRQRVDIADPAGGVVRTLAADFPIDPAGISNASEYVILPVSALWDGTDRQGRRVTDGCYGYSVSGLYLRVNESGSGQAAGKEKEIAASDTLRGTALPDGTPPRIISFNPARGESTADRRQRIEVCFADALSGVDTGRVALKLDWVDVTADDAVVSETNVVYTPGADLFEGRHAVGLSLEDKAGNSAAGRITFTVDIDRDADGLPDWWEMRFLGTLSAGGSEDPDGDGLSNLDEYARQTDPRNTDTDRDGFDDRKDNRLSRAFIEWGDPQFTVGNEYVYAMPEWLWRAYKDGGQWVVTEEPLGPAMTIEKAMGLSTTNPIPWPEIPWGNPDFNLGDEEIYVGDGWLLRVYQDGAGWQVQPAHAPLSDEGAEELLGANPMLLPCIGGLLRSDEGNPGFNPSEWHVSTSEPEGVGSLNVELDRSRVTNDLRMEIELADYTGSTLYVDLLGNDYVEVATNLFGNIIAAGSGEVVWRTKDVPLRTYPSAAVIRLRRGVGEIRVGKTMLYVDQDKDGLDADQEAMLGTSDLSADSDGDGTGDKAEVESGTDPTNPASFLASVAGTIAYAGSQAGVIRVTAGAGPDMPAAWSTALSGPGAYSIGGLATLSNYWISAFYDWNRNGKRDTWEPGGGYGSNPVNLTGNVGGVDITLSGGTMPLLIGSMNVVPGGMKLTIHCPDGFTNRLDIFACANLVEGGWNLVATNLAPAANVVEWLDPAWSNAAARFYVVGSDLDEDGDGLGSGREHYLYHTDPTNPDTDADGMSDGWEILHGLDPRDPADGAQDIDADGLNNAQEYEQGTDPRNPDTDGDGLVDGPDGVVSVSAYPDGADADHDGFVDGEQTYGTAANNADTDGDGYLDGWEAVRGYDPLNSSSPNPETGAIYITYPIGTNNPLISLYWPSLFKTCSMPELTAGVVQHIEGTVNAAVDKVLLIASDGNNKAFRRFDLPVVSKRFSADVPLFPGKNQFVVYHGVEVGDVLYYVSRDGVVVVLYATPAASPAIGVEFESTADCATNENPTFDLMLQRRQYSQFGIPNAWTLITRPGAPSDYPTVSWSYKYGTWDGSTRNISFASYPGMYLTDLHDVTWDYETHANTMRVKFDGSLSLEETRTGLSAKITNDWRRYDTGMKGGVFVYHAGYTPSGYAVSKI